MQANNTMQTTDTHCPYCALQCGMTLVNESGGLAVTPRPDFPVNKGGLCQKGWTAADLLGHSERLTAPLMRDTKSSPLRPVSWEAALARIACEVQSVQGRHGKNAVGVFGGGGLTNEKSYLLGKFARVGLQTSQIDYNGRFCMSSAAAANLKAFGIDRGLPFPLEDIAQAQAILMVGSNSAETMPPVMQYFDAQKENGGALIVADPRRTPTARAATLHLQLTPGTDAALANGLLHIAAADHLLDLDFIAARTTGFDTVRRVVNAYWPDRVERITGVPVKALTQAAHLLGEAQTAMVLTARGTEQQAQGVSNVLAFINLTLALGKSGRAHCGYGCLTGQGNGQGGREHGQKADQLPGYRSINNPAHRVHIANVWGIDERDLPQAGVSAYEMLEAMGREGGVRALFVFGSNLGVSAPRAGHVQKNLDALAFLCVSDIFLSETAARADVVLPCAQWAEESGTMTNLEGRVVLRRQAADPPPGVKTDTEILVAIAAQIGRGRWFQSSCPETIFAELGHASRGGLADYSGISYAKIASHDGVFWPCPDQEHAGTPRLFLDAYATPDGRARFHPVLHRAPAEMPDSEFPLYLTTGRVMAHYQSGTQTRRVPRLHALVPEAFAEMHPALAQNLGIDDGDSVVVVTRRGEAYVKAKVTPAIRADTIFIPFHWGGQSCANLLTNPALDPISKMPEFKVCAARVERRSLPPAAAAVSA